VETEGEHAMPQEMESGGGGPSPEGGFEHGDEHAAMNGGSQQMSVDQAMNENDQGMGAPGGAESEMVGNQNGPQQVENPNGGGFPNEAAFGRNEVPGGDQEGGMLKKPANSAGNSAETEYKSQNGNKRKSIPKHENNTAEKGPIPVDDETKRSTTATATTTTTTATARSKRQLDGGMYNPYPSLQQQQQQYPYAQEMNNNEQTFFSRAPKHHRTTTVNVDVVGKRAVDDVIDDVTAPKSKAHFLA
jgi:hypothetical protein